MAPKAIASTVPPRPRARLTVLGTDGAQERRAVDGRPVAMEHVHLEAGIAEAEAPLAPALHVGSVGHGPLERVRRHVRAVAAHVAAVEVTNGDAESLDVLDSPFNGCDRRHDRDRLMATASDL